MFYHSKAQEVNTTSMARASRSSFSLIVDAAPVLPGEAAVAVLDAVPDGGLPVMAESTWLESVLV